MIRTIALLAAVCAAAAAQAPVIGDINFYGLHKVTGERILGALQLKSGDRLPPSKGEMEDRIAEISGVVLANIEAVCCEGSQAILFIGIEERSAAHAAMRSAPAGAATLPEDLTNSYANYLAAVRRAAVHGSTAEDLTAGHSLMADPEARGFQQQFIAFATEHLDALRDVLRNAAEPEQRAEAAAVIGYAPKKAAIVDDLQYALTDPDEAVRANAIRSLTAIAVLAAREPGLGIRISPTWFVEMLNSIVLSDRVESVKALLTLTDRGDRSTLDLVRQRGRPSLAEMARWKTPRYALPPFLLLGRAAGIDDRQMQQRWEKGDREAAIESALKK